MKLVLFLNMGGVTKPEHCALFLKNMFNDPYILTIKNDFLRAFVAWCITKARTKTMQKNYEFLGGKSPLNELTARLCERLNKDFANANLSAKNSLNSAISVAPSANSLNLNANSAPNGANLNINLAQNGANLSANENKNAPQNSQEQITFDFINTYVPPFADEVLAKYQLTQSDEIVLFPLYPHHSQTTVLSSLECVKKALSKAQIQAKVREIEVFYTNEQYNALIIKHILQANDDFEKGREKTLIFSAHSLPVSTIQAGDIYQKHIEAHFALLKERLTPYFKDIVLGYQSKIGPVKWLTPATSEILANLDNVALIYPLSFCIDCSESVFELDIEYRKIAKNDYKVIKCPNDSAEFAEFIKAYLNLA